MSSILRRMREAVFFLRSRAFGVGALSVVVALIVYNVTNSTNAVYIRDGGIVTLTYTMENDVEDILEGEGIAVSEEDIVDFTGFDSKLAELEILRPFSMTLMVDGERQEISTVTKSVKDLLDERGLRLKGNDRINMDVDDLLYEGAELVIERIDYTTRTEERELPYETVQTLSSLLKPGRRKVLVSGRDGLEMTTYSQKLKDGEVVFEQAVDTKLLAEPVAQEELVGAHAAISPLDFGYECDDDGVPLDFVTVYRNQKATGYSARAGALTASGRYATPGHVAVNSDEIPYGTKLYIASPDNSFIYGYAIAADTGIGLMDGRTDVDLFYDSYTESVLNGVRYVDIYVLE